MRSKYAGKFISLGIIIIVALFVYTSIYFFGPDNIFEEKTEEVIKEKTGLDIDLSPSTPEF